MRNTKAAIRYAKSLLDLSLEQNKLDRCYADMQIVDKTIDGSRDLKAVLRSPVIKQDSKDRILNELFQDKLDVLSLSFLKIVGEKGRDAILPDIISAFIDQVKHHKHIMVAKVISATPLDDATRAKIREIISKVHNGELELVEEVNEDILGGFVLNIADKRIDASVRGQLRELRTQFEHNPYEPQI